MISRLLLLPALVVTTAAAACTPKDTSDANANAMSTPISRVPTYGYEVVARYPHDVKSFTEGLLFHEGRFFESTGEHGKSYIREVDLNTGRAIRQKDLDSTYFGEGIIIFGDKLYQLTFKSEIGFIYDWKTFEKKGEFKYQGEGWALTTDTVQLIMSNGSPVIAFRDPATFEVKRTIEVTDNGMPVKDLNELEWIKGEIWANIWQTKRIARISPADGKVLGWIDLEDIDKDDKVGGEDYMNGIAYDAKADRLFVTGKFWPKLYEIKLKPRG